MLGIINEHINFQVSPGQPISLSDDTEVVTLVGSANLINQKEIHWGSVSLSDDSLLSAVFLLLFSFCYMLCRYKHGHFSSVFHLKTKESMKDKYRFPVYEVDFGWGKPEWGGMPVELIFLFDTKCETGIEAIINLNEADMIEFENNLDINTYTS
ncbi:hypothetical protein POM88_013634 [Heracleum sosnowskyi]|uniref:Uncharacterized protein n=1 Tax=Heracleum sosnowskyi TaxID=360622 RepID=A0AAD8N4I9_9APIA|nr:hypothetical protein POM88_013634 [Heracleum sosnowskyi]